MSSVQVSCVSLDGKNPLDATGVHPESYEAAKQLLERLGYTTEDVKNRNLDGISKKIHDYKKLVRRTWSRRYYIYRIL